jgi:hypothetical protein
MRGRNDLPWQTRLQLARRRQAPIAAMRPKKRSQAEVYTNRHTLPPGHPPASRCNQRCYINSRQQLVPAKRPFRETRPILPL